MPRPPDHIRDRMAERFEQQLDPWQNSSKLFDFRIGFVGHIQSYLKERKLPASAADAKAWINKANFSPERHDTCTLQWEAYLEATTKKPERSAPPPVLVPDRVLPDGDRHPSSDAAVDRTDDGAVSEVPEEFRRQEGESLNEYRARMVRQVAEKSKKIGEWSNGNRTNR